MTRLLLIGLLFCGLLSSYLPTTEATYPYYGTKIAPLTQLHHGVSGEVYAVDSRTLFVKNFNYDGEAPSAYFYVGNTPKPSNDGAFRLRDERGSSTPLVKRYRNKDITLSLPEGKTLRDIKWFSVWCEDFAVNFGDVRIPSNLDFPRPQKILALSGVHGVSSDSIVIVDAQTLLVPNFSYDGDAPDAKFWVGRGSKPTAQGLRIPDENGKETPLRRYDRKTIVLTLPGDLTVFDIGHFGIWCEAFTVDFGHIRIPDGLNVPPSLKMLGISPQSKLNCEVLFDDLAFEVRWAVAGESVVVQLVAKLENGEYMSFGVSPNSKRTEMIGSDAVVAWVDKETGKGYAFDYYLDAKAQCSGGKGSCPDTRIEENTNSVRLLNAAMVNGYSIVTYQRPLKASDKLDLPIRTNGSQAIVWAIGPLNQRSEVSFHSKYTKGDQFINFGRQPTWNCPMPEGEARPSENDNNSEEYYDNRPQSNRRTTTAKPEADRRGNTRPARRPVPTPKPTNTNEAWDIPPIQCYEPEDGVFYAQLGPTGGKHGYPAITGHVGWGISWYINGLLIPEIHVVRGKTYTFVIEGGTDPETTAKYHPFYISDDPIGGYEYKTEEEKADVQIYAGVHRSRTGKITPTGVGRLCNWTPDMDGPSADEFQSFGAYQRTLTLKCDEGEPGVISWTPDKNTPDTVYYHCFTHRYLGWKIHVHDTCDIQTQGSEIDEVFAEPEDDFVAEESIRHETRVLPSENFLLQHEKDLIKNHNMNGSPPKISFELSKSSEITKLIADGIRAAEALEESITTRAQPFPTTPDVIQNTSPDNFKLDTFVINNLTTQEIQIPQDHLVLPNPELATFLRPPQNSQVFRPAKIPIRRLPPVQIERRPGNRPQRPIVIPQPSVIINHYRKQVSPIIRPFMKEKPFPIQPIASVLLLGQTSELGPGGIQRQNEPILKAKSKPGSIPVPYGDSIPQDAKKNFAIVRNGSGLKTKKPYLRLPVMPEKVSHKSALFKKPFEMKDYTSPVTIRPAINTGFQPDSVVVEGGFRPILRRRNDEDFENDESEEGITRRQDDNVSDIDEAIEKDALFFNKEDENQPFEPMFIPSPPDNANSTIVRKSIHRSKPLRLSGDLMDMEIEEGDDKMAVAAERLDTYYLPPETNMRKGVVVPDGAVVTYDGKAVLDMSLVNSAPPRLHVTEAPMGMSKTEQLVRSTPQFGPFRGEMPPPVPEYLPSDDPQSNLMVSKSVQNMVPGPVVEYTNPLTGNNNPISTKLTLLKAKNKRDSSSEA